MESYDELDGTGEYGHATAWQRWKKPAFSNSHLAEVSVASGGHSKHQSISTNIDNLQDKS